MVNVDLSVVGAILNETGRLKTSIPIDNMMLLGAYRFCLKNASYQALKQMGGIGAYQHQSVPTIYRVRQRDDQLGRDYLSAAFRRAQTAQSDADIGDAG